MHIPTATDTATKKFQNLITENNTIIVKRQVLDGGAKVITTMIDDIGLEDFKKSVFTCDEVKYSQTGKIYEMTFSVKSTD